MKNTFITTALLILLSFPNFVLAQKKEKCKICKEYNHLHASPYNTEFKKEWPFLLTGTSLAISGYLFRSLDNVVPYTPQEIDLLDRNDINAFDRGATYNNNESAGIASDVLLLGSAILPTIFLINHHTRNDIGPIALITLEVATINYGITNTVKSLVNRTRPYAYNPDLSYEERTDEQSRYSFFSGHTSVTSSFTFMFAKVISDYHPDLKTGAKVGLWSFASILPAATGYFRIKAGKHYPTDVITGYAVGALTGWLVPHLHKKGNENISLYPTRLYGNHAVGLTLKF